MFNATEAKGATLVEVETYSLHCPPLSETPLEECTTSVGLPLASKRLLNSTPVKNPHVTPNNNAVFNRGLSFIPATAQMATNPTTRRRRGDSVEMSELTYVSVRVLVAQSP
jgi:hypothetical protein